jgi:hypothetical protein
VVRALVIVVVGAIAIAACGEASKTATSTGTTDGSTAAPALSAKFQTTAEREVAALANKYVHGFLTGDYAAICATRNAAEQAALTQAGGGSCARALHAAFMAKGSQAMARAGFKGVTAGSVVVHGNKAGVAMVEPGQTRPALRLAAVREHDGWRLVDASDAETRKLLKR